MLSTLCGFSLTILTIGSVIEYYLLIKGSSNQKSRVEIAAKEIVQQTQAPEKSFLCLKDL